MHALIFSDLVSAQARSHAQAVAKGCTDETQFWWSCIANISTGQGAILVQDSGDYGPAGLTGPESTALVTLDPSDPNWFPNT